MRMRNYPFPLKFCWRPMHSSNIFIYSEIQQVFTNFKGNRRLTHEWAPTTVFLLKKLRCSHNCSCQSTSSKVSLSAGIIYTRQVWAGLSARQIRNQYGEAVFLSHPETAISHTSEHFLGRFCASSEIKRVPR